MASEQHIVIIGGGIIGCTTAYYLSHHPAYSSNTKITLIEASKAGVAQGASGKAGGLVAKWAYPKELVNISFPEHVKLAEKHDGAKRWGWRFVGCGSWEGRGEVIDDLEKDDEKKGRRKSLEKTLGLDEDWKAKRVKLGLPDDLDWVGEHLTDAYSPMAPAGDTAQVHPYVFTTSMLELAQEKGVAFIGGKVTEINAPQRKVSAVTYVDVHTEETKTIPATHVVLAAGPWSPHILPTLPIKGTRAHSVTIRPSAPVSPYVLFTEISLPSSLSSSLSSSSSSSSPVQATPEIYARPDGDVYCCGPGDDTALPDSVDEVKVDRAACDAIVEQVGSISRELRGGSVGVRQACFLPVVENGGGGPIVGEAGEVAKGLIVATGHTCWGICNAPGTAKAVAELILEGKISCGNLKSLHPSLYQS
ncbi:FAD dependent oxidoreductase [Trametopsis cervina]|nr:FAD dependent oxidoreductase [Trametopsis cervina]